MRTWKRSAVDTLCGNCHKPLRLGDPMQVITYPERQISVQKVRCGVCADGPVPPDLPAAIVHGNTPIMPRMPVRFGRESLPLDFKMAAAGREPGEDD